jgi:4-hydroxybenzoate polyprenyltransferase
MVKIEHPSFALHLIMIGLLAYLFWRKGLGNISLFGLTLVALLLAYEYSLVSLRALSRANSAFLAVDGWSSVLLFSSATIDLLWNGSN